MNWAPLLVILPVLSVVAAITASSSAVAARTERLARRVNLRLDDDVRPKVLRFERRRQLGGWVGASAGAIVAALLAPGGPPVGSFAVVIGMLGGAAVGTALAALVQVRRLHPAATASATAGAREGATAGTSTGRLTPVGIDDLVPRFERYGMRYTAAIATAITVIALGFLAAGDALVPEAGRTVAASLVFLALSVIAVLAWELAARRIVRRRPVGGATPALAWSDALRSVTLRDMIALPLIACLYGPFTLLTATGVGTVDSLAHFIVAFTLGAIVVFSLIAVAIALVVIYSPGTGRHPAQHYQRRLWPAIALTPTARTLTPDPKPALATATAPGEQTEGGASR